MLDARMNRAENFSMFLDSKETRCCFVVLSNSLECTCLLSVSISKVEINFQIRISIGTWWSLLNIDNYSHSGIINVM